MNAFSLDFNAFNFTAAAANTSTAFCYVKLAPFSMLGQLSWSAFLIVQTT